MKSDVVWTVRLRDGSVATAWRVRVKIRLGDVNELLNILI